MSTTMPRTTMPRTTMPSTDTPSTSTPSASTPSNRRLQVSFSAELEQGLAEAVKRLREKVDAVYGDCCEEEKMADLHYLAHDLIDREMELLVAADPEVEQTALVDLREQVRRHVHRLIEKTRQAA